jgi:hypothetical protein
MSVTALNGTLTVVSPSAVDVRWASTFVSGLYLYVDYTKGSETTVDVTFRTVDLFPPVSGAEYSITKLDHIPGPTFLNVQEYLIHLTGAPVRMCIPIPSPESAAAMIARFTFTGSLASSGSLTVFADTDNKYTRANT